MQLLYNAKARETGSFVVGACGWDSIPIDVGLSFLKREFPGTVAYAESFAHLKAPSARKNAQTLFIQFFSV